jgi:hypothetical protein
VNFQQRSKYEEETVKRTQIRLLKGKRLGEGYKEMYYSLNIHLGTVRDIIVKWKKFTFLSIPNAKRLEACAACVEVKASPSSIVKCHT